MDQSNKNTIGDILCEQGYLTPSQLEFAVAEQQKHKHRKLGHILLELGYVTSVQLYKAVRIQEKSEA